MMDVLSFLAPALVLSALLVGIHAYLGLHVLERDVIFVDISLSQVAALGSAISLFFLHEHTGDAALKLGFSLGLCLFAAFMLALLRRWEKKLSQEVLIGITYALASGALVLVMDKLPHGTEHLKEALVGNILFVTWPQVWETALVYSVVGLLHVIFRDKFWACTRGTEKSFLWDFLFYLLFGVVITFSTHHAGVLVVFSILVVPAALAKRFVQGIPQRLILAWILGLLGIAAAFFWSYRSDLPAGAAIVTLLTGGFFMTLFGGLVWERR